MRYRIPAECISEVFTDIKRDIIPNKTYVFKGGRGLTKSSFISLKLAELVKNNPNMHVFISRIYAEMIVIRVPQGINCAIGIAYPSVIPHFHLLYYTPEESAFWHCYTAWNKEVEYAFFYYIP